jgi:hypothetical protein
MRLLPRLRVAPMPIAPSIDTVELVRDFLEDIRPVAASGLPEQPRRRVLGDVIAPDAPAPMR